MDEREEIILFCRGKEINLSLESFQNDSKVKIFSSKEGFTYDGSTKDGKAHGDGMFSSNGESWDGSWEEGIFKKGRLSSPGTNLVGSFNTQGELNGHGTEYSGAKRVAYTGMFSNGQKEGRGTIFHENGRIKYNGEFRAGVREGYGEEYNDNETLVYSGGFKKDQRHGFGSYYSQGQLRYAGQHYKGQQCGFGVVFHKVFFFNFAPSDFHSRDFLYF